MSVQPEPVGEYIRLFCPGCEKEVAKINGVLFDRIKKTYPIFCVYHPQCEGLKAGEVLKLPSDWLQADHDPECAGGAHQSIER